MDDVEDDVHINSQEQRAKYEANYTRAIVPALATGGVIKVMGTILHQDSLLNNLAKQQGTPIYKAFYTPEMDKLYHEVRLPEIEIKEPQIFAKTKAKLLWPDMWSWETLMKKRQDMIINENRTDNAFFQEYRNEPIAEEERAFKFDWLWNPNRIMPLDSLLKSGKEYRVFAMIDLGESTSETADPTAAIVLFVDHDGNWYPVSVRNERRNVTAQIDLIFELWTLWSPFGLEVIGVERKAFDDQIKPLIYEESNRRNAYPLVQELKHLGKEKYVRILGSLQGRYERGKVWTVVDSKGMPIEQTEILKKQLYDLGKTKYDDLADTLAYGSQLVDRPTMGDDLLANNEPSDDPYNI